MNKVIQKKIQSFPETTGVYRFYESKKILYIGKAKNLKKRVKSYFTKSLKEYKTTKLVEKINDVDFLETQNETEALLLEQNLIKTEQPPYNILLRDDKTFPYIEINTKHDFPGVFFKRTRKAEKNLFGPFVSAKGTRTAISEIQKIFSLRTCNDIFFSNRSRPCLQYQIGKCSAPCVGKISRESYLNEVDKAKSVLRGNFSDILKALKQEMLKLSEAEEFEKALALRKKIEMLRKVEETQVIFAGGDQINVLGVAYAEEIVCFVVSIIENNAFSNIKKYTYRNPLKKTKEEITEEFVSRLVLANPQIKEIISSQEILDNPFFPKINFLNKVSGKKKKWLEMAERNAKNFLSLKLQKNQKYARSLDFIEKNIKIISSDLRIAGFDVSGGAGDIKTVSCIYFDQNGPDKSKYRFYRVPVKHSNSDLNALIFGIKRYLKNNFPLNIVLIDGGQTHLNFIKTRIMAPKIIFSSLGKGEKRKYGIENLFVDDKKVEFRREFDASKIFLDVRDEAHRFAIKNFRSINRKKLTTHFLQDIKGIGPKTINKIYKKIGSIENIGKLEVDNISQELGIRKDLAKKLQTSVKEIYT